MKPLLILSLLTLSWALAGEPEPMATDLRPPRLIIPETSVDFNLDPRELITCKEDEEEEDEDDFGFFMSDLYKDTEDE